MIVFMTALRRRCKLKVHYSKTKTLRKCLNRLFLVSSDNPLKSYQNSSENKTAPIFYATGSILVKMVPLESARKTEQDLSVPKPF